MSHHHHPEQRLQSIECAQGKDAYHHPIAQLPMDTISPTHHDSPVASSARYIRNSPRTPSSNPQGSSTSRENRIHIQVEPNHHHRSSPYYMDISPVSVHRPPAHFANNGFIRVPHSGAHGQSLCEDYPHSFSFPMNKSRESQDALENCPQAQYTAEPEVGDMDIDSPGYNAQAILNDTQAGSAPASPSRRSTTPFRQHFGRSASEGSVGKRSRMEEDDEGHHQHPPSSSNSNRSSCRRRLSHPSITKSFEAASSPSIRQDSANFNIQTITSNPNMLLFSPEPPSSSSMEDASPCLNALSRKTLHQAPTSTSPLSAFRFPVTKPTLNGDKRPSLSRKPRSSTSSTRSDSVPCRASRSKVAQSTATLFNRHLSLSTCLDITRLEDSAKACEGISDSEVDDERANYSEDPEDRSEFELSPVPLISVKKISTSTTNSKGKRCAAPLSLNYLQPPPLNSPVPMPSPSSSLGFTFGATIQSPVGIAFSEKERAGKILPCHKVSSDGLMRISPETMDQLLEGVYDDKISSKMIVDCRFAYEYHGGHIRQAINLPDKEAAQTMLLQGALFQRGHKDVPIPSESGKPDQNGETKKFLLVFHCEYSAMRAPTVAKYLREQDRHMNMIHYPALHYPEIYILEGGFAKYYGHSPQHCEGSYVRMDDPTYRSDRQTDLNLFRTRENVFLRTRSYTYGDSKESKPKKDPKRAGQGATRVGRESMTLPVPIMAGDIHQKENAPLARYKDMQEDDDDDDIDLDAQASSPLYMTTTAATRARRADLKSQGRSISMLAHVEPPQRLPADQPPNRKPFGSKTLLNRLALA